MNNNLRPAIIFMGYGCSIFSIVVVSGVLNPILLGHQIPRMDRAIEALTFAWIGCFFFWIAPLAGWLDRKVGQPRS
jgi:hypothetical protein